MRSTAPSEARSPTRAAARLRRAAALAAVAVAALAGAACGTAPPSPASPTGPPPVPSSSPSPASTGHVGVDCGVIPARGSGSFASLSAQRTVAAAASNPQLSVFSSAIRSAALTGELNKMRSLTLFIPVNSAFAQLSKSDVSFLSKPANVVRVVRHQAVPERVTPATIAHGGTVRSLSGSELVLAKRGTTYQVDTATVLCGNIKTANGTIYLIDRVLLPSK
ncbi:MAG TPA: fasciclin domain-containing protein [Streptosporangiaceae bacterium]|nr:fasciclin domain-containing protein [Streptosporangiaceae bacterium]